MSQNKHFMVEYKALEYSKNFKTITEHLLENKVTNNKRDPVKFEQGLELYAEWLGETFGNKIRREK